MSGDLRREEELSEAAVEERDTGLRGIRQSQTVHNVRVSRVQGDTYTED